MTLSGEGKFDFLGQFIWFNDVAPLTSCKNRIQLGSLPVATTYRTVFKRVSTYYDIFMLCMSFVKLSPLFSKSKRFVNK